MNICVLQMATVSPHLIHLATSASIWSWHNPLLGWTFKLQTQVFSVGNFAQHYNKKNYTLIFLCLGLLPTAAYSEGEKGDEKLAWPPKKTFVNFP